jgi:hypothetical protein
MKRRSILLTLLIVTLIATAGTAYWRVGSVGADMSGKANAFVATLSAEEKEKVVMEYDSPERVGWHFIPKDYRKGMQIKHMNEKQKEAALALLQSTLSKVGYDKATKIMELEQILHVLEDGKGRFARETDRYYYTVFGTPSEKGKWGLSIEGHHLSLNFVVAEGEVVSSTPTFFAANPATVKSEVEGGLPKGTRVLAKEEQLGFDLVNSLTDEQAKTAIIAEKAPKEIRDAGEPQPPADEKVGISFADLEEAQQAIMKKLVITHADNMPKEIREARVNAIVEAGPKNVRFAWAGATKPAIGHYYRIQGPTFLIEFVNTQPDPAGNPANHIHCVWRDMKGDFAIPIASN